MVAQLEQCEHTYVQPQQACDVRRWVLCEAGDWNQLHAYMYAVIKLKIRMIIAAVKTEKYMTHVLHNQRSEQSSLLLINLRGVSTGIRLRKKTNGFNFVCRPSNIANIVDIENSCSLELDFSTDTPPTELGYTIS